MEAVPDQEQAGVPIALPDPQPIPTSVMVQGESRGEAAFVRLTFMNAAGMFHGFIDAGSVEEICDSMRAEKKKAMQAATMARLIVPSASVPGVNGEVPRIG